MIAVGATRGGALGGRAGTVATMTREPRPAEPRPDGHIVQLTSLPSRFEADAVIGMLRANGVQAIGKYGDAEGWMPHMALLDGYRVFVFDDDLTLAKELLESEGLADGFGDGAGDGAGE